jgi:PAS domain S-box-containing protein
MRRSFVLRLIAPRKRGIRSLSLNSYLTRLIWLCVLPLLFLAVYLAVNHVQTLKNQRERDAVGRVLSVASTIDSQLRAHIAGLQLLAESPLIDNPPRLHEFYKEALAFRTSYGGHIILADLSTQMILNTRVPFGTSLPKLPVPKGHAAVPLVLATGKPAVSDMFYGPIARQPLVAVVAPIIRNNRIKFFLVNTFEVRQFQHILDELLLPAGSSVTVLDGKNGVIVHSRPPGFKDRTVDSASPHRFSTRSAITHWSVVLEVSRSVYRASIIAAIATLAAAILAATLVSILGGRLAGRWLASSIAELADTSPSHTVRPEIEEIEAVRNLLSAASAAREEALEDLQIHQTALQQSRDLLAAAEQISKVGGWEWDVAQQTMMWTDETFRVHGFVPGEVQPGSPEIIERSLACYDPEDRPVIEAAFRRCVEEGEPYNLELPFTTVDGRRLWIQTMARPVFEGERVVKVLGNIMDITVRKEMERAVLEERTRAQSYLDIAAVMFIVLDENGVVTLVNSKASEILGYEQEYIIKKNWFEHFLPMNIREQVKSVYRGVMSGEIESLAYFENSVLTRTGEERTIAWHNTILKDPEGRILGGLSSGMDITDRKRAEENLRELSQRLTYHVNNSPLAVIEWGPDMRLVRWSGEAEHMFGWKAEEVLGKRMQDFRWVYEEDEPQVGEVSSNLQAGINPHRFSTNRNYRKDGSVACCEWYSSTLLDESGKLSSILCLVLDITERKRAETSLQASLAEKEVLLREVHHRVKNNLASIIGLLDLQKAKITDEAALASLTELADRILSMAFVHESLYRSDDMARIDFQEYLKDLTSHLQHSYGVQTNTRCNVDATGVKIGLDMAIPIGLIINELVTNAMKHAFPKGEPRPGAEGCEILVTMRKDEDTCTLTVADNGVGLPPDLDWRTHSSLGLRLVSMLGEHQLRGQIQLDQSEGTRFVLRFKDRSRLFHGG